MCRAQKCVPHVNVLCHDTGSQESNVGTSNVGDSEAEVVDHIPAHTHAHTNVGLLGGTVRLKVEGQQDTMGLPHTATHCNTVPHTSAHCNTLQQHSADQNELEQGRVYGGTKRGRHGAGVGVAVEGRGGREVGGPKVGGSEQAVVHGACVCAHACMRMCGCVVWLSVCDAPDSALNCKLTTLYGVATISRLLKITGLFCRI